jgi:hypothetical protein
VATIVAAALLVGNWTSLPSKLFAQKNWWKFWTHTHTPKLSISFLALSLVCQIEYRFSLLHKFGNGEIPALLSTELHQLL